MVSGKMVIASFSPRQARIWDGSFWKVGSFENCLLGIFILGISGSLVSKFKLGVSKLSGILYFFYVFDSKMSLLDFWPFFFLIMYDDG